MDILAVLLTKKILVISVIVMFVATFLLAFSLVDSNSLTPEPTESEFTLDFTQADGNNTIVVTIKNQDYFGSSCLIDYQVFYNIRLKEHSAQDWQWTELYREGTYYEQEFTSKYQEHLSYIKPDTPVQSDSEYTIIQLTYNNPSLESKVITFPINLNTKIDVQIKALVGHNTRGWVANTPQSPVLGGDFITVTALDASSNWSSTQTITTITQESTDPIPTPSIPEYQIMALIPLVIMTSIVIIKTKSISDHWTVARF
jgi:hypothetical protein